MIQKICQVRKICYNLRNAMRFFPCRGKRGCGAWTTRRSWRCTGPGTRRHWRRASRNTAATAAPSPWGSWRAGRTRRSASTTRGSGPGRPCAASCPEREAEARDLAESLNRFLEALPREKRVIFVQRYWYLCSVEQLAAMHGMGKNTAASILFRLRSQLREHLKKEGFAV